MYLSNFREFNMTPFPKISVIVPIYNSERYLCRCIDSILCQSFSDFELILVNDGSFDSSKQICDEYEKKDSRIFVIHKENGGVTSARRVGVQNANGEWITFVDSDDCLKKNALELLFSKTDKEIDIVEGKSETNKDIPFDFCSIDEYRNYCISGFLFRTSPWAILYRKRLFDDDTFDISRNVRMGEDHIMKVRLAFSSKNKVCVLHTPIYEYRINESSVSFKYVHKIKQEYYYLKEFRKSIPDDFFAQYEVSYLRRVLYVFIGLIYGADNYNEYLEIFHSVFIQELKEKIQLLVPKSISAKIIFYLMFPIHRISYLFLSFEKGGRG